MSEFAHPTGWGLPYGDAVQGEAMGNAMAQTQGILMGRRNYEDFYGFWPQQTDNPHRGAQPNPEVRRLVHGQRATPVAELHPAHR
jgi:hypothetical protein